MARAPKIAILGCGTIVRRAHLPGLLAHGRAQVPVLYGPDTPNSHDVAATFSIPRLVHSVDEVFATPDLDGVVVALPNFQHASGARSAIAAGLPMLLEKPIAATIDDARDVVAMAVAAGVPVSMCLPQRQRPSMRRIKDLVDEGALGAVESIELRMTRRSGIPGFGGWFTRRELAGGGVLMDLGPHMLDLATWFAGCAEARDVRCRLWSTHGPRGSGLGDWGRSRRQEAGGAPFDVEDRASLSFDLASGTQVTCEVAWAVHGGDENRIRIVGDRGGVDYWPEAFGSAEPLRLFGDADDGRVGSGADHEDLEPAWSRVSETFAADVASGTQRLVGGGEALAVAEIIQRGYDVGLPRLRSPARPPRASEIVAGQCAP